MSVLNWWVVAGTVVVTLLAVWVVHDPGKAKTMMKAWIGKVRGGAPVAKDPPA